MLPHPTTGAKPRPSIYELIDGQPHPIPLLGCCPASEPAPCRGCADPVCGIDDDTVEFDPYGETASEPAVDHGYEPTAADWRALGEARDEIAARRHLDRRDLGLADLLHRQIEFFHGWGSAAGDLLSDTLVELRAAVVSTGATDAATFRERDRILRQA